MDHETEIITESSGRYLAVHTDADIDDYELKMLCAVKDDSLIRPIVNVYNGNRALSFDITGLISLTEAMNESEQYKISIEEFMIQLNNTVSTLDGYLLSERNLLLDKGYIFVDKSDEKLRFCAYPKAAEQSEHNKKLKELLTELIINADEEDAWSIRLCLRMLKAAAKKDCMLHDLMNEIILCRKDLSFKDTKGKEGNERIGTAGQPSYNTPDTEGSYCHGEGEAKSGMQERYYNHSESEENIMNGLNENNTDESYEHEKEYEYGYGYNEAEREGRSDNFYEAYESAREINRKHKEPEYNSTYRSPYSVKDLVDDKRYELSERKKQDKDNTCGIKIKILTAELILLAGLIAVFLMKGMSTVIKMLPVYVILSACTALYFIIGYAAEKKVVQK